MVDMIAHAVQIALGLCFAYASLAKAVSFASFVEAVGSYKLVRTTWIRPVSIAIIAAEASIAFIFLAGHALLVGSSMTLALLAVFAFATESARRRGLVVACMCFGQASVESTTTKTMARIALLTLAVVLVFLNASHDQGAPLVPWWASAVAGLCVLTASAVMVELSPLLVALVRWGGVKPGDER